MNVYTSEGGKNRKKLTASLLEEGRGVKEES
jgi:hypothetical protein